MKSSFENNQEYGEQIDQRELGDIATAMEHFIKCQIPLPSTQFKLWTVNL